MNIEERIRDLLKKLVKQDNRMTGSPVWTIHVKGHEYGASLFEEDAGIMMDSVGEDAPSIYVKCAHSPTTKEFINLLMDHFGVGVDDDNRGGWR